MFAFFCEKLPHHSEHLLSRPAEPGFHSCHRPPRYFHFLGLLGKLHEPLVMRTADPATWWQ